MNVLTYGKKKDLLTWNVRPVGSLWNPSTVTVKTGDQSDSPTSMEDALRMKSSMVQSWRLEQDLHTPSGSGQLFRFLDIFVFVSDASPSMKSRRPSRGGNDSSRFLHS